MSGSYDIYNYLESYYDDNVYFNNPTMYLKNLNDDYHLPRLQKADSIVIVTGQGSFEAPDRSRELSDILHSKGIPHLLELWGHDVNHDWPWWRKMLPYYLGRFTRRIKKEEATTRLLFFIEFTCHFNRRLSSLALAVPARSVFRLAFRSR